MPVTTLPHVLPAGIGLALGLGLAVVLAAIAVIDRRSFRIPDWLSLPLAGVGLGLALLVPGVTAAHHVIGAAAGWLVLAAVGEAYFRRRGVEGLGLGDAKLFAAAGAWLGWAVLPQVLLIAAAGGLAQAQLRGRGARAAPLAFGPWLAFGFGVVWFVVVFMAAAAVMGDRMVHD